MRHFGAASSGADQLVESHRIRTVEVVSFADLTHGFLHLLARLDASPVHCAQLQNGLQASRGMKAAAPCGVTWEDGWQSRYQLQISTAPDWGLANQRFDVGRVELQCPLHRLLGQRRLAVLVKTEPEAWWRPVRPTHNGCDAVPRVTTRSVVAVRMMCVIRRDETSDSWTTDSWTTRR